AEVHEDRRLILHSDCDGTWTPAECRKLASELRRIGQAFKDLPPISFPDGWQTEVAKLLGLKPRSLYDSFIDVDGESLLERMLGLCEIAVAKGQDILFQ